MEKISNFLEEMANVGEMMTNALMDKEIENGSTLDEIQAKIGMTFTMMLGKITLEFLEQADMIREECGRLLERAEEQFAQRQNPSPNEVSH